MKRLIIIALVVAGAGHLAAFAQAPPFQWAVDPGGGYGGAGEIALDPAGNLLVIGGIAGQATFGTTTLGPMGTNSGVGFLAEYTLSGASLRAIPVPRTLFPGGVGGIAVDGAGNIYLNGGVDGGVEGITLGKYDADWNLDWVTNSSGGYWNVVAVDPDGNCYLTGDFTGGSVSFGDTTVTGPDFADGFVAKFDPNGNCLWAQSLPAAGDGVGYAVAVDSSTNVLVSGLLDGEAFVAKFDQNGNNLWLQQAAGTGVGGDSRCTGIAADQSGNVYVIGIFSERIMLGGVSLSTGSTNGWPDDVFVAKFDGEGNLLWAIQGQNSSLAQIASLANGVCTDRYGNCCITGSFASKVKFGATTLTNPAVNAFDVFVAKVDPNGNWLWATSAGGGTNDGGSTCSAIASDQFGNLYVAGRVSAPANFGGITLENSGIFIARIDAINPPTLSMSMTQTGTGSVLSWPTNATGFIVQSTSSLTPPIIWADNTNLPVILNGQYTLTNTLSPAAQFFRLKQ
jgi:catechol 2,3-dioxygenase-like lactoylglutathione lyase family enzyme